MTKEQAMRNTKRPIPNDAPSSDATSSTTDANLAGKRNKMTKLVNKKTKIYKFAPVDNITDRKSVV